MRRLAALIALVAFVALPAGAAASWSSPARLGRTIPGRCITSPSVLADCFGSPETSAAVNAHGKSLVAWTYLQDYSAHIVSGDSRGRFGREQRFAPALRLVLALRDDGSAVAVWRGNHGLMFALRGSSRGRFGAPRVLTPPASKEGDDEPQLALRPDGSVVVFYDSPFRSPSNEYVERLRALVISRAGHPSAPVTLGSGFPVAFATSADGGAVACCVQPPFDPSRPALPTQLAVLRGGQDAWGTVGVRLRERDAIESVGLRGDQVAVGTVAVANSGDAGTLGTPGVVRGALTGGFGDVALGQVVQPGRAFGPLAAVDAAGNSVLVFQEKRAPSDFQRHAPLYGQVGPAAGPLGRPRVTLDSREAQEPQAAPIGDGVLVAWDSAGRWGAALERDGRFQRLSSPLGGPDPTHDANTNRALATGGRFALLAWEALDGRMHASIRRL